MAGRAKHMARSHRSYHNPKPFLDFERKANFKAAKEQKRKSMMEVLKAFFHRNQSK